MVRSSIEYLRSKVLQGYACNAEFSVSDQVIAENFLLNQLLCHYLTLQMPLGETNKSNVTLIKKVQVLRNLVAKIVLYLPKHSSAPEAFDQLGWDNLTKSCFSRRLDWLGLTITP